MQGKNHIALALAIPLAGALAIGPEVLPGTALAWGGLILGSLAPDLDGEGSIAYWGNFLPRHITPQPVIRLLNWAGRTVSSLIRALLGHRNALHWPLWGALMVGAGGVFGLEWLSWVGFGYILHILGDALTKSGVPIFGPIWRGDISLTPMVTGKAVESGLGVLLWLFAAWRLAVELIPQSAWLWQQLSRFSNL